MSRELWKSELEAALAAVKALEEVQKNLPMGYYFDGALTLVMADDATPLGKIKPNDVDEFVYEPLN